MFISGRVINTIKKIQTVRKFCNTVREELTVQTFCDINVNVPYNVKIQPLDVHKYHNCDVLKFELQGATGRKTVKHLQDGNNIKIFANFEEYDEQATCFIQAPVKANLNITAQGNISTGVFSGSKLFLRSVKGNIFIQKFQGDTIDLNTDNGDIILKGAVVASNITAVVANTGSIKTKRLQGLKSLLKTNNGNIIVDSSYCDNGVFEATSGDMNLQNIHKFSKIIMNNGKLNLGGIDGQLEANLKNTTAEIQISRILEDSKIILNNGELKLMLSEECQDNTMFEILADDYNLDQSIRLIPSKGDGILYLTPTVHNYKTVHVECPKCPVSIQNTSWMKMMKLNMQK